MPGVKGVPQKWRPSMVLVVVLVCLVLISIPVLALLSLRLTSNQFVRETEQALLHQAAILSSVYAMEFAAQSGPAIGPRLSQPVAAFWNAPLSPSRPSLNLRTSDVLPPLPDSRTQTTAWPDLDPRHAAIAPGLLDLARQSRDATLTGAIFLDHRGTDIGRIPRLTFADQPDIAKALEGRVAASLRTRGDTYNRHPLTSLSRNTWYRVFVAYPVILQDRVVGVVYLSRTPSNFAKFVITERFALLAMVCATLLSATIVGWLLLRLVLRPVRALGQQSQDIAAGTLGEPSPLPHYGIRELADMGDSVMQMSKTLTDRSRQISVYTDHVTHELKSPVTAILGAAELLNAPEIDSPTREKLRRNIEDQGRRMNALLDMLRRMTQLRDAKTTGSGPLAEMLPDIDGLTVEIAAGSDEVLPMLPEHGRLMLHQLARNAAEHGADRLTLRLKDATLRVSDNGSGIAPQDLPHVTDPFFTTRRESGGTGLGLAIVSTILQNYDATPRFLEVDTGAMLEITFVRA